MKEDLQTEIRNYIIKNYAVRSNAVLDAWLNEVMKDFYNYNEKAFFSLTEKETEIFRKKYLEGKINAQIAREHYIAPSNIPELIRRKKRELIKKIGVMYRLHFNKDTYLENTLLWPTTIEKLGKTGLRKMSDITKLSKREFEIITSIIPEKVREEILDMMKTYKIEFEGPEIIIEDDDLFIDELNLKNTTLKSLFWCGIKTKSQLLNLTKEELKQIIGIGQDGVREILDIFARENILIKEKSDTNKEIEITNIPISRLNLNPRTLQALYRNNIKTLDELFKIPARNLKQIKGLGIKSFEELLEKIRYIGYKFPEKIEKENIESIKERIENSNKKTNDIPKQKVLKKGVE